MKLSRYPETLAVVRLGPGTEVPAWAESSSLFSVTATATETSIVCAARSVPKKSVHQRPFTAFEVEGPLDFALTGVLAELLAAARGRRDQRLHALDLRHRLDPRPGRRRRPGRGGVATIRARGHRRRPRQATTRKNADERHPPQPASAPPASPPG